MGALYTKIKYIVQGTKTRYVVPRVHTKQQQHFDDGAESFEFDVQYTESRFVHSISYRNSATRRRLHYEAKHRGADSQSNRKHF